MWKARKLVEEIASGQLSGDEVRELSLGRLFSVYVLDDKDQIAAHSVIELMYRLRLAGVYDRDFCIETTKKHKHYDSHLTGGAVANLIGKLFSDMTMETNNTMILK